MSGLNSRVLHRSGCRDLLFTSEARSRNNEGPAQVMHPCQAQISSLPTPRLCNFLWPLGDPVCLCQMASPQTAGDGCVTHTYCIRCANFQTVSSCPLSVCTASPRREEMPASIPSPAWAPGPSSLWKPEFPGLVFKAPHNLVFCLCNLTSSLVSPRTQRAPNA